ncbi:RNA polymerase sigma factor [Paraburkholderia jirisanensis]
MHLPNLRRYARKLIRCRDRADDLVQDTAERALRYANSFEPGTDLRKWLFTIMYNTFINDVKRTSRICFSSFDDEDWHGELSGAISESHFTDLLDLQYALQLLPADQRDVVLMIGVECMTYECVATQLGIPCGTVMSRLARARRRLRHLMAGAMQAGSLLSDSRLLCKDRETLT